MWIEKADTGAALHVLANEVLECDRFSAARATDDVEVSVAHLERQHHAAAYLIRADDGVALGCARAARAGRLVVLEVGELPKMAQHRQEVRFREGALKARIARVREHGELGVSLNVQVENAVLGLIAYLRAPRQRLTAFFVEVLELVALAVVIKADELGVIREGALNHPLVVDDAAHRALGLAVAARLEHPFERDPSLLVVGEHGSDSTLETKSVCARGCWQPGHTRAVSPSGSVRQNGTHVRLLRVDELLGRLLALTARARPRWWWRSLSLLSVPKRHARRRSTRCSQRGRLSCFGRLSAQRGCYAATGCVLTVWWLCRTLPRLEPMHAAG